MKPIEPLSEDIPAKPGSWAGLGALLIVAAVVAVPLVTCSCAELRETTFSVSYQDEQGEVFTVTRVGKITPIHAEK